MKKNLVTLLIGGLLILIFAALLFLFQVRTTEIAVVTTFGKYSATRDQPGLYFRAPLPIQKVYKFDKRLQTFERRHEENFTRDKKSPIITIFVGWRIADARKFLEAFNGDTLRAEQILENVIRDAKNAVIGRHDFSELISPDPEQIRFDEIQNEMREAMAATTRDVYGIEVELVGFKRIELPEALTAKVFDRMKTERERLVKKYTAEGTSEATKIRSEANRKRDELLARADAQARIILGGAEAEAAKAYQVLQQDPEFANFIIALRALESSLKERTTLILDDRVPPMNLFKGDAAGSIPVPSAVRRNP